MHIVDDLLTKQANNAVEEANGAECRTVMEDGQVGSVSWSYAGACVRREF